jgi:predicted metal-dependent enzyme (double-stranded beta helix superfamily)
MTYTNGKYQTPRCLTVGKPVDKVELKVHGQGVVLFDASGVCCLTFCDVSGTPGLKVQFTESQVLATLLPSNEPLVDPTNKKGLVKETGAYYWLSLDSQNQRIYAGIGEARKETVIYSYQWPQEPTRKSRKLFLESLTSVTVDNLHVTALLRDPITRTVPLLVKNTEHLTMDCIASSTHLPKANLSIVAQKLYDCIAGKHFVLDSPDFPEFSKAIEHSIKTPGKWCYERLKEKATEFDKDKPNEKETYLRITLNENNGESPGIPYVMEVWPVGHYSPIHNHAGASAIIRVLHGSIHVSLFPFLSGDELEPFAKAEFNQGDITWISPSLNQVHQLKNAETNKETCITIQCYMYKRDNTSHYDYFDYLDADGKTQQYEPDSDMEFLAFKALMKREWLELKAMKKSWFCFTR